MDVPQAVQVVSPAVFALKGVDAAHTHTPFTTVFAAPLAAVVQVTQVFLFAAGPEFAAVHVRMFTPSHVASAGQSAQLPEAGKYFPVPQLHLAKPLAAFHKPLVPSSLLPRSEQVSAHFS